MGWFKTKEDKQIELQTECDRLNEKYKDVVRSYCLGNNKVFIFNKFVVRELHGSSYLAVDWRDTTCIRDGSWTNVMGSRSVSNLGIYEPEDIEKVRLNWLKLRDHLEKLGIELKQTEDDTGK